MATDSAAPSVVLVHGGFVDGSGWRGVYDRLKQDGYSVAVVQNPTVSHADDVAVTKLCARRAERAGHPGRTLLRRGRDHRGGKPSQGDRARSTIAAFVPDKGESVNSLIGGVSQYR